MASPQRRVASAGLVHVDTPQPGRALATLSHTAPKILLYSHDTCGLGNIRRTLLLSQALIEQCSRAMVLIVTVSPLFHAFRIPDRSDYINMP
jgi:predicted glycosyltransferase